jgi:hypothetical protein
MKIKFIFLCFLFRVTSISFSQTTNCRQDLVTASNVNALPDKNDPYWTNDGEVKTYSVTPSTPTLSYNINFHFLLDPNIPTTFSSFTYSQLVQEVQLTVISMNNRLMNSVNVQPLLNAPNPSQFPPIVNDSRLRFNLNGVYVHTTSLAIGDHIATNFKTVFPQGSANGINIYIYWDTVNGGFGVYDPANEYIKVSVNNETYNIGDKIKEGLIFHELCHAFGHSGDYYWQAAYSEGTHYGQYNRANHIFDSNEPWYLPDDATVDPSSTSGADPCVIGVDNNNVMGSTSCRYVLSNRQVAYFHYLAAKNITKKYTQFANTNYPYTPAVYNNGNTNLTLSGTQTISTSFVFDRIDIMPGAKITFTNTILYGLTGLSKVIVHPGSKLILNGVSIQPVSTFTNMYWGGIEVRTGGYVGQSVDANGFGVHGILEMTNSTIERAIIGVLIGSTDPNTIQFLSGGWVIANDCKFIRNNLSVKMYPFPSTNVSLADDKTTFTNCNFESNSTYRSLFPGPFKFVELDGVRRVKFITCAFFGYTNDAPILPTDFNNLSYGIKAYNSSFIVSGTSQSSGVFNQLDYGIYSSNFGGNYSSIIQDTYFQSKNGIYISNGNNAKIVRNTFEMDRMPPLGEMSTGLYLNECNNFKVENNNFLLYYPASTKTLREGIVVNNSGLLSNQIYNNRFSRLQQGIWCQNQNWDPNSGLGLKLNCNDFINCDYAIGVQSGNPIDGLNTGIATYQGYANAGIYDNVRNTYSSSSACTNQNKYWQYTAYNIPAQLQHGSFLQSQFQVSPQPNCSFASQINNIAGNPVAVPKMTYCPDQSLLPSQKQFVLNQFSDLTSQVNNLQIQFNTQLDNGNTDYLLSQVEFNSDFTSLKNDLLTPEFLSDTVLKLYFIKPDVSPIDLLEVFQKNAPASSAVYNSLISQNLPTDITNHINELQNQNILSSRSDLLAKIAMAKDNQSYAAMHKAMWLVDSNLVSTKDSLATLITFLNQGDVQKQLIELDLAFQDYYSASRRLAEYGSGSLESQLYADFTSNYLTLLNTSNGIHHIKNSSDQLIYISTVANDEMHPCFSRARHILNAVYDTNFPEVKLQPFNESGGRTSQNNQSEGETLITKVTEGINLFPNPAQNVAYLTNATDYNYKILITDLSGKALYEDNLIANSTGFINAKSLLNGIYFVNLYQEEKLVKVTKLIIAK